MNDIQHQYFKDQERVVQECYDPSIRIFFNPRIDRWIICEDSRVAKKQTDPWLDRDVDLEGVEGVGEKTPFRALKKLETIDGKPIPPLADVVIKILALECPRKGDRDMTKIAWEQVRRREARSRQRIAEMCEEYMKDVAAKRRGRKIFV